MVHPGSTPAFGAEPQRRALRGLPGPGEIFGGTAVLSVEGGDEEQRVLEAAHALVLQREECERTAADHPEFALACIRALLEAVSRRDLLPGSGREA